MAQYEHEARQLRARIWKGARWNATIDQTSKALVDQDCRYLAMLDVSLPAGSPEWAQEHAEEMKQHLLDLFPAATVKCSTSIDLAKIPTTELKRIDTATRHRLLRCGLDTLADIATCTRSELAEIRGIGRGRLNVLVAELTEYGMELRP